MNQKLFKKCIEESFYSGYHDAKENYQISGELPDDDELEKNILLIGWFIDSINSGGLDSFLYSSASNYYSDTYKVLTLVSRLFTFLA